MNRHEEPAPPPPAPTSLRDELEILNCGRWEDPKQFLDKYITVNMDPAKANRVRSFLKEGTEKGWTFTDEEIASAIIREHQVRSRLRSTLNSRKVLSGAALTILLSALAFFLLSAVYLLVLYIVYGYTAVKRHLLATVPFVGRLQRDPQKQAE
jgi:hypothetical protein